MRDTWVEQINFTVVENEKCRRVNSLHILMIIIMHNTVKLASNAILNTGYQQNKIDELNENEIEK